MRIRSSILLIAALLIFAPNAILNAQSGADYYLEQGNIAYRQGDYAMAFEWYEKILDLGYENGVVYYNMGNCKYKLDEIGEAILYYEKALKFRPDDPEVKTNLQLSNLKVIDRIEMPPQFFLFQWWNKILNLFSVNQLPYLVFTFYYIATVLILIYFFTKGDRPRRIILSFFIVTIVLAVFWGFIFYLNIQNEKTNVQAIVVTPTVTVESAPEESSTVVFILHEGVKVRLREQRGDWVRIELPDGKSGWLQSSAIKEI
jgi:tetratricopeptide (TPR) repeat protein